tara:strand:+ start:900 stop:3374 length:2475 start_codon:yes stop_codon:yes gene_type:complete
MKENFSQTVQKIMKNAKEEAIQLGHSYVGSEHLLLGILREVNCKAKEILEQVISDVEEIRIMIQEMLKTSTSGTLTLGHLPLTRRAERILRNTFAEASVLEQKTADDEHLLLAILKEKEGIAIEVLNAFEINYSTVFELIKESKNLSSSNIKSKKIPNTQKSKTPALDHFSRDITQLARMNKLDPVIGRKNEIERLAQILCRRKKNNPVLIGEPGVGKTAIAEGLAQKITTFDVPRFLYGKRILDLDLAGVVSGTKYRGQFEERVKAIMNEIESSDDIILFIDELHTIIGAGSASGSLDASNMFKPALSRGEIHCIGATTLDEYRKHIEKDGALDRRFQKVNILPPSIKESIEILNGLKINYEKHHNVKFNSNAIKACVELSERYISDKFLPDKAIDVMDEAGSKLHIQNLKVPDSIIDLELKIEKIRSEKDKVISSQQFEKAASLRDKEKLYIMKLNEEKKNWSKNEKKNISVVSKNDITDIISMMTGIPISDIAEKESQKLLKMNETIKEFIIGQDSAIDSLTKAIQLSRTGLKDPNKPIGIFLLLGPTGVGKTETAKILSKQLFPHNDSLVKIDMSEYMERFAVSRLIGAPPGYIGFDEGGELTEVIRRKPYSLILFDEIEKAHPDVFNILLQLFDEGFLTDSMGRKVDFRNTIIILTSNIGTREFGEYKNYGFEKTIANNNFELIKSEILNQVQKIFSPEFINRLDESIVYKPLNKKDILKIVSLQLNDLYSNIKAKKIKLFISIAVKNFLLKKGYSEKYGARKIRRVIKSLIETPISELILKGKLSSGDYLKVDLLNNKIIFNKNKIKLTQRKKKSKNK